MINFNDLPKDVLQKIPLSLRTAKNKHYFKDLPPEIQYLLSNYNLNTFDENDQTSVKDIHPDISIYNDFKTLKTTKEIVIEYLSNHLKVLTGSYPYDIHIGSNLKYHLQTKDTTLRSTLVFNELNNIVGSMSNYYNIPIRITDKKFSSVQYEDRTEIQLNLTVTVDDEDFAISIN